MVQTTFKNNPVTLLGNEVKVGDKAPDFTVLANDLSPVSLKDSEGKIRLFSVVPSLDTGVCDAQTRRFNEAAAELGDNVVIYTVSMDLPFAQNAGAVLLVSSQYKLYLITAKVLSDMHTVY